MRLLIDANILLDVLQNRESHVQASSVIWKLCETEKIKDFIAKTVNVYVVFIKKNFIVFFKDISTDSLCVSFHHIPMLKNYPTNKKLYITYNNMI